VEDPLWVTGRLIDKLEQVRTRMDAAIKVWPQIGRTLNPAMNLLDAILQDLYALKDALGALWQEGFEVNWKK
jgi:hypothetical protein